MRLPLKIFLLVGLTTFLPISIYSFYFFSPRNANYTFEFKDSLLKQHAKTSKTVIIGGSNGSYGYDSKEIERQLDTRVVNMGISVEYGLEFYLNWITPYLIPNDRVILSLEYDLFHGKAGVYGNYAYIEMAYSYPDFFNSITSNQDRFLHFGGYLKKYLTNLKRYVHSPKLNMSANEIHEELLKSWTLNGDRINWENYSFINYFVYIKAPDENFTKLMKPFINYCEANNIEVYLNFPPVRRNSIIQKVSSKNLVEFLNRELPGIRILNKPEDAFFEDKEIYDSPYHLLNSAKGRYTREFCSNLKRSIQSHPDTQ